MPNEHDPPTTTTTPDPYAARDRQISGPLTRARASLDAVRVLAQLRREERPATDDERAVLVGWSGWGPLAPVFNPKTDSWREIAIELSGLLTPEEWETGEASTYNAFYTPPAIARGCWSILTGLGFDGGRVLEPGCGAGVFMAHAPDALGRAVRMVGVERDPTTAGIAAALHPGAQVIARPLQDAGIADYSVDAVIGNVPFGDVAVHDPTAPRDVTRNLHNYFLWRSVQALRPGGVAVLITSRYSLDSTSAYARQEIANDAVFLGAVRLPNAALSAGGTEALTDVVVLRRRRDGDAPGPREWLTSSPVAELGGEWVNDWLTANPRFVLGTLATDRAPMHGRTVRVDPPAGPPPSGAGLADWVGSRLADAGRAIAGAVRPHGLAYAVDPEPGADTASVVLADPDGRKERSFHVIAGQVKQVRNGQLTRVERADRELVELIVLRDAALALLAAESDLTRPDHLLMPLRLRLNVQYDRYKDAFGALNRSTLIEGPADPETGEPTITRRRPRMGGFRQDPDYVTVLALEVWDDETQAAHKAPIFRERVNRPARRPDHADTPGEALALCLDAVGRVDLAQIARLLRINDPAAVPAALGDLVYLDPTSREWVPADEYLSGNVRTKLAAARRAADRDGDTYARNVAALEKVHPVDLEPGVIRAKLGSPWIPADDVADFLGDLLKRRPKVTRVKVTAAWEVEIAKWVKDSPIATQEWGTQRASAYTLAELALNGKAPVVYDSFPDGSKVRNVGETMAAEAKQREIAARFAEWVWEDPARSDRLAAEYNRLYNSHVLRRFDGSHLTFPGLVDTFRPYKHQPDMVYRMLSTPRALCGHPVGAGKTATMFMAATTLRRLGLANKPLIVVPNHLLEQVAREGRQLFPSARILMAGKDDLGSAADRKLFAARAATGDWDAVVITHNAFTAIPVHPHTQARYLSDLAEDYRRAIGDRKDERSRNTKQLAKQLDRLRTRATELMAHAADDGVYFEHLGTDYLLIDEAHYFKNLSVPVRTDGFSINPSKRATDLDMKLRWLGERRDRCATLFTGTPVSNTMLELYVLLHYLMPDRLAELEIDSPDAWAANFVEFVSSVEVAPDGVRFRLHRRPAKFVNVPELRILLAEVADIRTADSLGLPRPAARYHTVVAPSSALQRAYIANLADRADAARSGADRKKDNMLKICSDGRKAALDTSLLDPADLIAFAQYVVRGDVKGKVGAVVDRVAERYHATTDRQFPDDERTGTRGTLQIVFCDLGTPNPDKGSQVYGKIRAGLVAAGVPAGKVRFIHDANTDAAKAQLFADCRAGRVAVLLGSTDKLGVGTNVQRRVSKMHHVDAPWRPADLEQRDGRGLRPGNLHRLVDVDRYITRGSFDSYMWQTLERKKRFIDQVLTGSGNAREVEDIGDGSLSYGEIKALATGNPVLLEKAAVDAQVARLRSLATAHTRGQRRLRQDIDTWEGTVTGYGNDAQAWDAIAATAAAHVDEPVTDGTGETLDDDKQVAAYLGEILTEAVKNGRSWKRVNLHGVEVAIRAERGRGLSYWAHAQLRADGWHANVTLSADWAKPGQHWRIRDAVTDAIANAAGEANRLRGLSADFTRRIEEAKQLEGKPLPHAEELAAAQAKQAEIDDQIRAAAAEAVEKGQVDADTDDIDTVEVHSEPMPDLPPEPAAEATAEPEPEPDVEPQDTEAEPDVEPDVEPVGDVAPVTEPEITYQAAWSPAERQVTVIQDVRAGVSGPFGDYPAASREEAETVLHTNGYAVSSGWSVSSLGDHWCRLVRVPQPTPPFPHPAPFNRAPVAPTAADTETTDPWAALLASIEPAAPQPASAPAPVVTLQVTRLSIDTQIREALAVLGLPYELAHMDGGARYVVGGCAMTPSEAANYLLAGGFDAAYGRAETIVHPDRLAERDSKPADLWADLLASIA